MGKMPFHTGRQSTRRRRFQGPVTEPSVAPATEISVSTPAPTSSAPAPIPLTRSQRRRRSVGTSFGRQTGWLE